jgi:hypothetical protein
MKWKQWTWCKQKQTTNSKGVEKVRIRHEMSCEITMQKLFMLCGYDFLFLNEISTQC